MKMRFEVSVKFQPLAHMFRSPAKATDGSVGYDLFSTLSGTLEPGERKLIPVGFRMAVPPGYEVQIRPRSGLALKHGVTVLNSPGTIDPDYRGEVGVLLINLGSNPWECSVGSKIAQMIIARVPNVYLRTCVSLEQTKRGSSGFGSTGD